MEERKKIEFRKLRADEIDCRINTVSEKGVSLLLYKDARVDQNILDETVGPMNWQRHHSRENANCTVSIWDSEKSQWIEKEDTGTESYTEKEKGLASDSFKRACFNWGIGRELYTAPFIWINSGKGCSTNGIADSRGSRKYTCYDRFHVSAIGYDTKGNIDRLEIKNNKSHIVVYRLGEESGQEKQDTASTKPVNVDDPLVEQVHINTLAMELLRTGIGRPRVLRNYNLTDLHEMRMSQFKDAMEILRKKPDKPVDPATIPPEGIDKDEGLPWTTPDR